MIPPVEALKRVEGKPNLRLLSNTADSQIRHEESKVIVETNRGVYCYDFIILVLVFDGGVPDVGCGRRCSHRGNRSPFRRAALPSRE